MTGSVERNKRDRKYVPLSKDCFQRIGKPLPSNVHWEDILESLPKESYQQSWSSALGQLLTTVLFIASAFLCISYLPWFLMPVGWALAGLGATGLLAIERDCSRFCWVDSTVVNEIVGIATSIPLFRLFVPKTAAGDEQCDKKARVYSGGCTYVVRVAVDNTLVFGLFAALLGALYYFTGVAGVVKYWGCPFVAFQLWRYISHKMHLTVPDIPGMSVVSTMPVLRVQFPKWLALLNHLNHVTFELPSISSPIPSYRLGSVYRAIQSQWSPYITETRFSVSSFLEALRVRSRTYVSESVESLSPRQRKGFVRYWVGRLNWLHIYILFGTPAFGIYGFMTTPLQRATLVLALAWYLYTGWGITAGYHRLWAHRAYRVNPIIEWWLMLGASGAVQGSAKWWCRGHRAHHRYTDTAKDPYNAKLGFWYAHLGWMLVKPNAENYGKADVSDLKRHPILVFQHKYYLALVALMAFIMPALIAGLGWGDYRGGFFYAGVIRLVFVHHTTFCVNSVAHFFGDHTFDDERTPKDHIITAFLTLGEGYHNFHHEFPYDYRNGIRFYDYDPTKWLITVLNWFGLAYDLRQFSHNEIEKGKLNMQQKKLNAAASKLTWPSSVTTLPEWSWDEIKKRVAKGEDLIVIHGLVHDMGDFMLDHPGGEQLIRAAVGTDATENFTGRVYKHSNGARNLLSSFRVARLPGVVADATGANAHLQLAAEAKEE